ncbi:MAG: succinic semialdehyde dehydrogenase [Devosia sp.]|nr:succinic semialdehyde dehydrogenase [Devosia sp.]
MRLQRQQMFIGGQWVDARSGQTRPVIDPATQDEIGTVPFGVAEDTTAAIAAAKAAFDTFAFTTAQERSVLLRRLGDAVLANQEDLALLLVREQGKPLREARAEIAMSAAYIHWFAEEARRSHGEIIPSPWPDHQLQVTHEPVGVVGAITPWNFPSSMIARKVGPALAAGCTVVLKPAEATPYSALAWGVLAEQAGLPKGVLNIVTGKASAIGGALMASNDVRKITFTGSTPVGQLLLRQAADSVKRVSMELGGNAPFIVFDDADVDAAVAGALASKYRNSGQTCVCTNRIYVQSSIHDAFVDKLAMAARQLRVGSGLDADTDQGPLIDIAAVEKVEALLADAVAKGGRVVAGGQRHALGGAFFEPTVLTGAHAAMDLAVEEIFGPVAPVFRFETEDEAIRLANATELGLASYFYARDIGRIQRVSRRLEYGMVGINTGLITTEVAPFGGVKQSGLGREGSSLGLHEYTNIKYRALAY